MTNFRMTKEVRRTNDEGRVAFRAWSFIPHSSLCESHDGFDHTRLGQQPRFHLLRQLAKLAPMADPGAGVDLARLDHGEDAREVGGDGVAAGEEGQFAAVEEGIVQEDGFFGDADIDDAAGEPGEAQRACHGVWIAGGVENDLEGRCVRQARDDIHAGVVLLDEFSAGGIEFEDGDGGVRGTGEFEDGEADGAGSDDENIIGGGDLGAVHGVAADGQSFDEGELLEVEGVAGVELGRGKEHALAHAAVAMHAEDLQCFAAVGAAALAGVAGAAVEVGLDGATVTDLEMRNAFTDGEDFDAELMPEDARKLDEGHLTEVAAEVGAADADGTDGDEDGVRPWSFRCGECGPSEGFGGGEGEGAQVRGER